ncbi:MEDS domain-containing protein [Haloparvum sp. PAK95]|uniref:MEDS domain-containing protein n=1 Tax=Haloparvum sp. PAK95 TaxID=3418962 RepID=UPI003D2EEE82
MSQQVDGLSDGGDYGPGSGLEALRRSSAFQGPVEPLDGHDHAHDHFALVHEDREEQFGSVVPFVRQGLDRNERCMYVADDHSRAEIVAELQAGGVDAEAAIESGALSIHTTGETYLEDGSFDPDDMIAFLEEAIADATADYESLRVAAEMTWVFGEDPAVEDLVEYEGRVNELFSDGDIVAVCQYDETRFPPAVIRDVVRTHPMLIRDNVVSHNVYYTPPGEFFGPDNPEKEVERMLGTLRERTEAKVELKEHTESLREQNEITADPDRDFEEKLQALFELGCDRFDVDLGGMARIDADADRFELEYVSGDHEHMEAGLQLPLSETYCRAATSVDTPASIDDPESADYDDVTMYQEYGLQAYLGTAIEVDGATNRTFFFVTDEPRTRGFTEDEREFLQLMGQWVKYELEHRRHEQDQRRLYEIAADTERTFEEKIQDLFEFGCERFDLDLGGMARIDRETDRFIVERVSTDHTHLQPDTEVALSETYCRVHTAEGQTTGIADPLEDGFEGSLAYEEFGVNSYLGTRIGLDDDLDRTLFFVSSEPRNSGFTEAERTFLDLMGQWVGYELERRRREEYLRKSYEITSDATLSFGEKVEQLLELGCERFDLEMAGLNHLPSWDGEFRLETGVGLDVSPEDKPLWTDPDEGCFCRQTMLENSPVCRVDVRGTKWEDDRIHRKLGLTSYFGTRVTSGSTPYGTLWFASEDPRERPFTDAQRTFLDLMGQWVSYEIERREHKQSQRELYEITANSDLTTDEKIDRLLEVGRRHLDLPIGALNRETGDSFVVEQLNSMHPEFDEPTVSALPDDYCRRVVDTGEPFCTVDVESAVETGSAGPPPRESPSLAVDDLEAYAGIPVSVDGATYGSIFFVDTKVRTEPFTEGELAFLDLMSQCIGYELERRQHKADLEKTIDQLQQSNDRLKQFAYAASHDLQEPLRMVSSYLQLLDDQYGDDLDETAHEYVDFAVDGAERMREMVDDLLAYSRVEQSEGELERVDTGAVLDRTRDDLQARIEKTDATVSAESLPTVRADRDQLEQLFRNLVSNGIKYNEADPAVEVDARKRAQCWEFTVADDGIGIDPGRADRIFEVFKRLHHDDEYTGTGIGLSLCQEIVENHGGDIWVESEPGTGSTFHFTLPRSDAQ